MASHDRDMIRLARLHLEACWQGNRPFADYFSEFCRWADMSQLDNNTLRRLLLRGLSDELQSARRMFSPEQLEPQDWKEMGNIWRGATAVYAPVDHRLLQIAIAAPPPPQIKAPLPPLVPAVPQERLRSPAPAPVLQLLTLNATPGATALKRLQGNKARKGVASKVFCQAFHEKGHGLKERSD
jgi:hypothetical protein